MQLIRSTVVRLFVAVALILPGGWNIASADEAKSKALAVEAQDIFRANCFECHGQKERAAGLSILERDLLVGKEVIVPEKPEDSLLYHLITGDEEPVMPPPGRPRLTPGQVTTIKEWIALGAPSVEVPPPPARAPQDPSGRPGSEYVLRSILQDVRQLSVEQRRFVRYLSLAHLKHPETDENTLSLHRDALAKAINHLTWKSTIVRPTAVEKTNTVYRIDLRELGWDHQPFRVVQDVRLGDNSSLDIYDLALLEYPYGMIEYKSDTYAAVLQEYLTHAFQIRPIPYVRADWLVSTVTQAPLYEDFLQLPRRLTELEKILGVDREANIRDNKVVRAGVSKSGVSRNNRVVERHESNFGPYWISYDFSTSKAGESIFKDPVNLQPSGGEVVFTLPNGLQGYFIVDAEGNRIDEAPTNIVVDEFASDKTVRNGLSCMRCHDRGVKSFADDVRRSVEKLKFLPNPGMDVERVLELYPEQSKVDALVQKDEKRFLAAMEKVLGKPQAVEPLKPVSAGFFDERISFVQASAELGLADTTGLKEAFQSPQMLGLGLAPLTSGRRVARDLWQDSFDLVVRGLKLAVPVVPLDGLTEKQYEPTSPEPPFKVELRTNKRGNTFAANDTFVLFVKSDKDVFIELIGTNAEGKKVIITPSPTQVKAGTEVRFPPEGQTLRVPDKVGKEQFTLIASEEPFRAGVLLRGPGLTDRVVHAVRFVRDENQYKLEYLPHPFKTVKKTITIETK